MQQQTKYSGKEKNTIICGLYQDNFVNAKYLGSAHIPKIIHQIWLGSEFPEKYKEWQATWLKYNPGWEYRLWTDKDIKGLNLTIEDSFYKTTNWGAKSDILRFELLYKFGGLYADTDMECLRSFETLHSICDLYAGLLIPDPENPVLLSTLFGAAPGHPVIKACMDGLHEPIKTRDAGKQIELCDGPYFTKCFFEDDNFKKENKINLTVPHDFFYPWPAEKREVRDRELVKSYFTENTYSVHYWEVSWHQEHARWVSFAGKFLPVSVKAFIKRMINW